jgi:hypothetical protein
MQPRWQTQFEQAFARRAGSTPNITTSNRVLDSGDWAKGRDTIWPARDWCGMQPAHRSAPFWARRRRRRRVPLRATRITTRTVDQSPLVSDVSSRSIRTFATRLIPRILISMSQPWFLRCRRRELARLGRSQSFLRRRRLRAQRQGLRRFRFPFNAASGIRLAGRQKFAPGFGTR